MKARSGEVKINPEWIMMDSIKRQSMLERMSGYQIDEATINLGMRMNDKPIHGMELKKTKPPTNPANQSISVYEMVFSLRISLLAALVW